MTSKKRRNPTKSFITLQKNNVIQDEINTLLVDSEVVKEQIDSLRRQSKL